MPALTITLVAPIFQKPGNSEAEASVFRWIKHDKARASLLHGVNADPPARQRVAAFDLDGTIIVGKTKVKDALWWEWWRKGVPQKLKELANDKYVRVVVVIPLLCDSSSQTFSYSVVLISNQALGSKQLDSWKKKVALIAAKVRFAPPSP
jgi:bifunctional polynucleotide phosphatase/kinase